MVRAPKDLWGPLLADRRCPLVGTGRKPVGGKGGLGRARPAAASAAPAALVAGALSDFNVAPDIALLDKISQSEGDF